MTKFSDFVTRFGEISIEFTEKESKSGHSTEKRKKKILYSLQTSNRSAKNERSLCSLRTSNRSRKGRSLPGAKVDIVTRFSAFLSPDYIQILPDLVTNN